MIELSDMKSHLSNATLLRQMHLIYGEDEATQNLQQKRIMWLGKLFAGQYPHHLDIRLFSASGRTEVAGNHTDHQRGHVLCASVNLDILAMASPNAENIIRIKSREYSKIDEIDLTDLTPQESEFLHSAALMRGIAAGFHARGLKTGGFDAYTISEVPKGSGLSSSASFEIMIATILNYLYNEGSVSPVTMALIAQSAENDFFGKPCGLMDQCGCSIGGMMTIDFKIPRAPVVNAMSIDFEKNGYALIITNTGGSHADLNGDYASIPADMKKVAQFFGKEVLRDVPEQEMIEALPALRQKVGDKAILRAMHFFADDKRVLLQAAALQNNDIPQFLQSVNESGISSWTLLQNIYSLKLPEEQPIGLGLAVSKRILGERGACRVHGGGFAGTVQAFVPCDFGDEYIRSMEAVFGKGASMRLRIRNLPATELFLE